MLLHGCEDYFDPGKRGVPYASPAEEGEDYFALLDLVLEAFFSAWLRSADMDGDATEKLASFFSRMPEDRGGIAVNADDRQEIRTAWGYVRSRETEGLPFSLVRNTLGLSDGQMLALLMAASVHRNGKYARLYRDLSLTGRDGFPTVGLCEDILAATGLADDVAGSSDMGTSSDADRRSDADGSAPAARTAKEARPPRIFAPDGVLYTYLLARRSDEGARLRPRPEEPLVISPYVQRLLDGAADVGRQTDASASGGFGGDFAAVYARLCPRGLSLADTVEDPDFFADFSAHIVQDERLCGNGVRLRSIDAADERDIVYVLAEAARQAGRPLYVSDPEEFPETASGMQAYLLHLRLFPGMLYLTPPQAPPGRKAREDVPAGVQDEEMSKRRRGFLNFLVSHLTAGSIYMTERERRSLLPAAGSSQPGMLTLPLPDIVTRQRIWEYDLAKAGLTLADGVDLADIADCHEISRSQIAAVAEQAKETLVAMGKEAARTDGAPPAAETGAEPNKKHYILDRKLLQKLLFALSETDFDALATEVSAHYTWDDIFLEESAKQRLKAACDRFRLRHRIGAAWGITEKNAYGNAVILLMYGAPGTGKTMAAQAIANEVMLPLYRVDVSQIFSKYIGETQKNLSRIFDEAAKRSVVLFFDEADALFTRRTDIKDSHDKYANSDTSFLLQKVEEYNGISILATNNFQSFDPAFMRRITYVAHFERPDEATRLRMWKTMLPEKVPFGDDVDMNFLAERFTELTGANIKSILLAAAYMAAAVHRPVGMRDIITAITYEYEKSGRLIDSAEFGTYAIYL